MIIEIDSGSGFCFGVTRAIERAEEILRSGEHLNCLGDIVHNGIECSRLHSMGLKTIDHKDLHEMHNTSVLLRAHGEPPSTYQIAQHNGITIYDATCPVVLALQKRIKNKYLELVNGDRQGSIVIFGKKGHAEVLGLLGQTEGKAIVIERPQDAEHLDFSHDIYLYSQTTKSLDEFHVIIDYCQKHISPKATFQSFDTICRQVSNRMKHICEFATRHDVIFFVSGAKSSNGKVLYEACKEHNPDSYLIERPEEIETSWLAGATNIGICGATSTPKWLMEQVAEYINRHLTLNT